MADPLGFIKNVMDAHGAWLFGGAVAAGLVARRAARKRSSFDADWFQVTCYGCGRSGFSDVFTAVTAPDGRDAYRCVRCERPDVFMRAETAYSMIEHQDGDCLKDIADSLRPKYNLDWNEGDLSWDWDSKTGDVILYIYDGDNKKLDEITYDRKALATALKEQGYKNPESWGAETFGAFRPNEITTIDDFNKVADALETLGIPMTLLLEKRWEKITIVMGRDATFNTVPIDNIMDDIGFRRYGIVGYTSSLKDKSYNNVIKTRKLHGGHKDYGAETFGAEATNPCPHCEGAAGFPREFYYQPDRIEVIPCGTCLTQGRCPGCMEIYPGLTRDNTPEDVFFGSGCTRCGYTEADAREARRTARRWADLVDNPAAAKFMAEGEPLVSRVQDVIMALQDMADNDDPEYSETYQRWADTIRELLDAYTHTEVFDAEDDLDVCNICGDRTHTDTVEIQVCEKHTASDYGLFYPDHWEGDAESDADQRQLRRRRRREHLEHRSSRALIDYEEKRTSNSPCDCHVCVDREPDEETECYVCMHKHPFKTMVMFHGINGVEAHCKDCFIEAQTVTRHCPHCGGLSHDSKYGILPREFYRDEDGNYSTGPPYFMEVSYTEHCDGWCYEMDAEDYGVGAVWMAERYDPAKHAKPLPIGSVRRFLSTIPQRQHFRIEFVKSSGHIRSMDAILTKPFAGGDVASVLEIFPGSEKPSVFKRFRLDRVISIYRV